MDRNIEHKKIIEWLNRKDNKAFQYLYFHYYGALHLVARNYVNDEQTAKDIIQEVFILLLEDKHQFATLNDVKYYLYTLLRNKALNYIRHQRISQKYNQELLSYANDEELFWEYAMQEDIHATLLSAVHSLSPQNRDVILLSMEGLKLAEIAQQLNISINTAKAV